MMSFTEQMKAIRTAQQKKHSLFNEQIEAAKQQEIMQQKKQLLDNVKSFVQVLKQFETKQKYCTLFSSQNYIEVIENMKNQLTELERTAKALGLDTTALRLGKTDSINLLEQQSQLSLHCYNNYYVHFLKMAKDFEVQLETNYKRQ